MRMFSVLDEFGMEYKLNSLETGFFAEPSGLGYAIDAKYEKVGTKWVQSVFEDKQGAVTGVIIFGSTNPYQRAAEFLSFIRKAKRLTLKYSTPAGTYYRDIDQTKFDKGELGAGKLLECSVTFACRSLWYDLSVIRFEFDTTNISPLRYDYVYGEARYESHTNDQAIVINSGTVPAGFTAEFDGAIGNPTIEVIQGGEVYGRVTIYGTAAVGEKIIYSSIDGELYCYRVTADGMINLVDGLNIENTNFFKIPVGTSTIRVSASSEITNPISINVYKRYRSA